MANSWMRSRSCARSCSGREPCRFLCHRFVAMYGSRWLLSSTSGRAAKLNCARGLQGVDDQSDFRPCRYTSPPAASTIPWLVRKSSLFAISEAALNDGRRVTRPLRLSAQAAAICTPTSSAYWPASVRLSDTQLTSVRCPGAHALAVIANVRDHVET